MDPLSASAADPRSDLLSSADLFEQFLNERRYLKNVTADTIEWYETAWKAFRRTSINDAPRITRASLQTFVVRMRQRNVKPVSINTYIKALNAFCRWLHQEAHHAERLELQLLTLEKRILPDAHRRADHDTRRTQAEGLRALSPPCDRLLHPRHRRPH